MSSSNPESLAGRSIAISCVSQAGKFKSVGNEGILLRVKEERNILHEISKRIANWIGHILRRNCLYGTLLKER